MDYMTEHEIDTITNETGAQLSKEARVLVTVTTEHGEPYWEGGINGCFFRIRTNTPVAVPKSLAALIAQSAKVRLESKAKLRAYEQNGKRVS